MATYVLEVENATIPAISTFPVTNTITSAVGVHQTQTSSWLPSPSVVCTVRGANLFSVQFNLSSTFIFRYCHPYTIFEQPRHLL